MDQQNQDLLDALVLIQVTLMGSGQIYVTFKGDKLKAEELFRRIKPCFIEPITIMMKEVNGIFVSFNKAENEKRAMELQQFLDHTEKCEPLNQNTKSEAEKLNQNDSESSSTTSKSFTPGPNQGRFTIVKACLRADNLLVITYKGDRTATMDNFETIGECVIYHQDEEENRCRFLVKYKDKHHAEQAMETAKSIIEEEAQEIAKKMMDNDKSTSAESEEPNETNAELEDDLFTMRNVLETAEGTLRVTYTGDDVHARMSFLRIGPSEIIDSKGDGRHRTFAVQYRRKEDAEKAKGLLKAPQFDQYGLSTHDRPSQRPVPRRCNPNHGPLPKG